MDVDIKDYDSTSKDDDIDHLFYTFKSIASTESATVVLNGTKVQYVYQMSKYVHVYNKTNHNAKYSSSCLFCFLKCQVGVDFTTKNTNCLCNDYFLLIQERVRL